MAAIGYRAEIDAGRRFLEGIEPDETVVLLFEGDTDGCAAAAIVYRTLRQMGNELIFPVFVGKEETIYSDAVSQRVLARDPSYLIVLDVGSRIHAIVPGLTTMVIDHHRPGGIPPVDLFITSYGVTPPATTSLLAYELCKTLAPLGGLEWLAAVGAAADMGIDADIDVLSDAKAQYGANAIESTATLVGSARRSACDDVAVAFELLIEADGPPDIAELAFPEATVLESYRKEVNAEVKRVLQLTPEFSGQWALIKFRSPDLIHPMVATTWAKKWKDNSIMAANYGYVSGKVHFSACSATQVDLIDELSRIRPANLEVECCHDHGGASEGILPLDAFKSLLKALGFPTEVADAEP